MGKGGGGGKKKEKRKKENGRKGSQIVNSKGKRQMVGRKGEKINSKGKRQRWGFGWLGRSKVLLIFKNLPQNPKRPQPPNPFNMYRIKLQNIFKQLIPFTLVKLQSG